MAILAYNESKLDTRQRNLTGYILFFISILALLVLDLATSGKGGIGNFIGICIIVAAFRVADAHVQGGMVGDLSFMCPKFIQLVWQPRALTSALRLITKAAFEKLNNGLRKGTIIFPKLPIVKYYRSKAASEGSKTVSADLAAGGIQTEATQGLKSM